MKPIWRNAAVGTPAKQPIAVAVDQPPETSELPVELEAWVSILSKGALGSVPVICQFGAFMQQLCASEKYGMSLFIARSKPGLRGVRRGVTTRGVFMQVLLVWLQEDALAAVLCLEQY